MDARHVCKIKLAGISRASGLQASAAHFCRDHLLPNQKHWDNSHCRSWRIRKRMFHFSLKGYHSFSRMHGYRLESEVFYQKTEEMTKSPHLLNPCSALTTFLLLHHTFSANPPSPPASMSQQALHPKQPLDHLHYFPLFLYPPLPCRFAFPIFLLAKQAREKSALAHWALTEMKMRRRVIHQHTWPPRGPPASLSTATHAKQHLQPISPLLPAAKWAECTLILNND